MTESGLASGSESTAGPALGHGAVGGGRGADSWRSKPEPGPQPAAATLPAVSSWPVASPERKRVLGGLFLFDGRQRVEANAAPVFCESAI